MWDSDLVGGDLCAPHFPPQTVLGSQLFLDSWPQTSQDKEGGSKPFYSTPVIFPSSPILKLQPKPQGTQTRKRRGEECGRWKQALNLIHGLNSRLCGLNWVP